MYICLIPVCCSIQADPPTWAPALIQRAELLSKVSVGGRAQSVARYDLLTKATLLEIRLPAESTLWTVFLDDQPTKPQKENDSLLLSLPAQERITLRKLQLAYESPVAPLASIDREFWLSLFRATPARD